MFHAFAYTPIYGALKYMRSSAMCFDLDGYLLGSVDIEIYRGGFLDAWNSTWHYLVSYTGDVFMLFPDVICFIQHIIT